MYPDERSLVTKLQDRPFALIGVNSDSDRAKTKAVIAEKKLTWRSFWNGGGTRGGIAGAWNVRGWPTVYVIDHAGVIRHKDPDHRKLAELVEPLVRAAEKAGK